MRNDEDYDASRRQRIYTFRRCEFHHTRVSASGVPVPVVGEPLQPVITVQQHTNGGEGGSVHTNDISVTCTAAANDGASSAAEPSNVPPASPYIQIDEHLRVHVRWLRGPPRVVCLYHPHSLAKMQCASTLRCFCSYSCFTEAWRRLGSQHAARKPRNPFCLGVPCRDFCTPDDYRDPDYLHLQFMQETPLGVPKEGGSKDVGGGFHVAHVGLTYRPGSSDLGRQLRCQVWLQQQPESSPLATTHPPQKQQSWKKGRKGTMKAGTTHPTAEGCTLSSAPTAAGAVVAGAITSASETEYDPVSGWAKAPALIERLKQGGVFVELQLGVVIPKLPLPPVAPFISLTSPSPVPEALLLARAATRDPTQRGLQQSLITKLHLERPPNPGRFPSFSVLTWNVLADVVLRSEYHPHCEPFAQRWEYRKSRVTDILVAHEADIICLQEVQEEHYLEWFRPVLAKHGYQGHYKRKSAAIFAGAPGPDGCDSGRFTADGCATFYRTRRFRCWDATAVEYAALICSLWTNPPKKAQKDNVALFLLLEDLKGPSLNFVPYGRDVLPQAGSGCIPGAVAGSATAPPMPLQRLLVVGNTHIVANPQAALTKLLQAQLLLKEVEAYTNGICHKLAHSLDKTQSAAVRWSPILPTSPPIGAIAPSHESRCSAITAPTGHCVKFEPSIPDPDCTLLWKLPPSSRPAIVLAGDFNSEPTSTVHRFITTAQLDWDLSPANASGANGANAAVDEELRQLASLMKSHKLPLSSSIGCLHWRLSCAGLGRCFDVADSSTGEPEITNYADTFKGCLDYLFFDREALALAGGRVPIGETQLRLEAEHHQLLTPTLPSHLRPSDHVPLMAAHAWKDVDWQTAVSSPPPVPPPSPPKSRFANFALSGMQRGQPAAAHNCESTSQITS